MFPCQQAIVSRASRPIATAPSSAHRLITIIHRCGRDTTNNIIPQLTQLHLVPLVQLSKIQQLRVNRSIKEATEYHRGTTSINRLPTSTSRTSVRDTSLRTTPQPQQRTAPQTDRLIRRRKAGFRESLAEDHGSSADRSSSCTATARLARLLTPLIRLAQQQQTHLTDEHTSVYSLHVCLTAHRTADPQHSTAQHLCASTLRPRLPLRLLHRRRHRRHRPPQVCLCVHHHLLHTHLPARHTAVCQALFVHALARTVSHQQDR